MGFDIPSPGSRVWGRFRQEGGFTLVEVLLAVALLAIVAVTFMPMIVMGAKMQYRTKVRAEALNYARQQIEMRVANLRNTPSASWPTTESVEAGYGDGALTPAKPGGMQPGTFNVKPVTVTLNGKTFTAFNVMYSGSYKDNASGDMRPISVDRFVVPGIM